MLDLAEGVLQEFAERAHWGGDDSHWRGLDVWPARKLGFPQRFYDPEGQKEANRRWSRSPRGRALQKARLAVWLKTEAGKAANRRGVAKWRSKPENRAKRNEQRRRAYAAKKEVAAR